MSDNLVKQALAEDIAKGALGIDWYDTESAARRVAEYAADRIEALQAELAYWKTDSAAAWDKCEERRLKNARLREALDWIANYMVMSMAMNEGHLCRMMKEKARAALQETDK